jgi:hypothetical protein
VLVIIRKLNLLLVVALLTAPFAFAGEFDDFEKSLLQEPENAEATDSATSMSANEAF